MSSCRLHAGGCPRARQYAISIEQADCYTHPARQGMAGNVEYCITRMVKVWLYYHFFVSGSAILDQTRAAPAQPVSLRMQGYELSARDNRDKGKI